MSKKDGETAVSEETTGNEATLPVPLTPAVAREGEVIDSPGDRLAQVFPWESWTLPETTDTTLGHVRVAADHERKVLLLEVPGSEPAPIGKTIFANLGEAAQFPVQFLEKLSLDTAATVINERIQNRPAKELRAIKENGRWLSLVTNRREFVPTRLLAETAHEAFASYGEVSLVPENPEEPYYQDGRMLLRFLSPKVKSITPRRGDVLRMGVEISQVYGESIDISLYVERLVCTNGMIAGHQEISFRGAVTEVKEQLQWVREKVLGLEPVFLRLQEQAVAMSQRQIPSNVLIPEALANYARQNGIHGRLVPLARNAWDRMYREEEAVQPTEWDLANAFTRAIRDVRTYESWPRDVRFLMQERIGEWVRGDEIVTARLRRKDAEKVHAEIVSEES